MSLKVGCNSTTMTTKRVLTKLYFVKCLLGAICHNDTVLSSILYLYKEINAYLYPFLLHYTNELHGAEFLRS